MITMTGKIAPAAKDTNGSRGFSLSVVPQTNKEDALGYTVEELQEVIQGLRAAVSSAMDRAVQAEKEAERYKKLYESATKRKHELFLGVIAVKKALEEVV